MKVCHGYNVYISATSSYCSAGATGVLLNIDRVSATLAVDAPGLDVHGIVDSGWFLDTEQFQKTECTNTINCPPAESVKKGFR